METTTLLSWILPRKLPNLILKKISRMAPMFCKEHGSFHTSRQAQPILCRNCGKNIYICNAARDDHQRSNSCTQCGWLFRLCVVCDHPWSGDMIEMQCRGCHVCLCDTECCSGCSQYHIWCPDCSSPEVSCSLCGLDFCDTTCSRENGTHCSHCLLYSCKRCEEVHLSVCQHSQSSRIMPTPAHQE